MSTAQKYTVNPQMIETILSWVKSGEIAIPEIQRPFVWDATQVRNLIDSLFWGFPVGYLITWRNPNVRLKDGSKSQGKKILIDGQQRVTALRAALLGEPVLNKHYQKVRIRIAFHPLEKRFEVYNPAIGKDVSWMPDISPLLSGEIRANKLHKEYIASNVGIDEDALWDTLGALSDLTKKQIGLIDLEPDLDIETVTEIFIRINKEGTVLSQADFAMSKIAANETYGGQELRKAIDYFCHMATAPEFHDHIKENDKEFAATDFFQRMVWLRNENDDLYDPGYTDLLRVAFTSRFDRGKLSDLVALLSGRNFETREYEEEIARESFEKLRLGVMDFISETNFKRFLMIVQSAGFVASDLIRSQNALNFAYILFLKLRNGRYNPAQIEHFVRRWLVMSLLTGRYSGAADTSLDADIRALSTKDVEESLRINELGGLSDAFWTITLPERMDTSGAGSPFFNVFLAAQVKANDRGFLSRDITVNSLISQRGDIHHIFPKEYLRGQGLLRSKYNQIANYAYMQSEINIPIGKQSPKLYLEKVLAQCAGAQLAYGAIVDRKDLSLNLAQNCIPETIVNMEIGEYEDFLKVRRRLMAEKMKAYYYSL